MDRYDNEVVDIDDHDIEIVAEIYRVEDDSDVEIVEEVAAQAEEEENIPPENQPLRALEEVIVVEEEEEKEEDDGFDSDMSSVMSQMSRHLIQAAEHVDILQKYCSITVYYAAKGHQQYCVVCKVAYRGMLRRLCAVCRHETNVLVLLHDEFCTGCNTKLFTYIQCNVCPICMPH